MPRRPVIPWFRVKEFKVVSLKMIVSSMLLHQRTKMQALDDPSHTAKSESARVSSSSAGGKGKPSVHYAAHKWLANAEREDDVEGAAEDDEGPAGSRSLKRSGSRPFLLSRSQSSRWSSSFRSSMSSFRSSRSSRSSSAPDLHTLGADLYVSGEVTQQPLGFSTTTTLIVSAENPGAGRLAQDIIERYPNLRSEAPSRFLGRQMSRGLSFGLGSLGGAAERDNQGADISARSSEVSDDLSELAEIEPISPSSRCSSCANRRGEVEGAAGSFLEIVAESTSESSAEIVDESANKVARRAGGTLTLRDRLQGLRARLEARAPAPRRHPDKRKRIFLLYLNQETWLGAAGSELADQVRAARTEGIRVVLVHECDPTLGGCEFAHLFKTTPQDLISDGLYARIAVAFHTGQHRAVSLCLLAREIGAVRYRVKGVFKWRGGAADAKTRDTGPAQHGTARHLLTSPFEPSPDSSLLPELVGGSGPPSLGLAQLVSSGSPWPACSSGFPPSPEEASEAGTAAPNTPSAQYAAQKLLANAESDLTI